MGLKELAPSNMDVDQSDSRSYQLVCSDIKGVMNPISDVITLISH